MKIDHHRGLDLISIVDFDKLLRFSEAESKRALEQVEQAYGRDVRERVERECITMALSRPRRSGWITGLHRWQDIAAERFKAALCAGDPEANAIAALMIFVWRLPPTHGRDFRPSCRAVKAEKYIGHGGREMVEMTLDCGHPIRPKGVLGRWSNRSWHQGRLLRCLACHARSLPPVLVGL